MITLTSLPLGLSLQIRIEVIDEQIELFEGYIEKMPVHREYYESVIIHLDAMRDGLLKRLEEIEALGESQCSTLN